MSATFSIDPLPAAPPVPLAALASRDRVDPDRLRRAMGRLATGVSVVTTRDPVGRPFGSTAGAVSSVSLRPPLVLSCLSQDSETLGALIDRGSFAVNVLRSSQTLLADSFAHEATEHSWDAIGHPSARGIPLLHGAIATLECELHDIADGGDHMVVIGRVVALEHTATADGDPLLVDGGFYRSLA